MPQYSNYTEYEQAYRQQKQSADNMPDPYKKHKLELRLKQLVNNNSHFGPHRIGREQHEEPPPLPMPDFTMFKFP